MTITAIPSELIAALATDTKARTIFAQFPPSHQREYAKWVGEAKQSATRQTRAKKTIAQIKAKAAAKKSSAS
jgi:uncharacterized protein YdeI (YjbR/CyaY-like superfamily)